MDVMKMVLKFGLVLLLLSVTATAVCALGTSNVRNTVHNLSAGADTVNPLYYTNETEVCIFCHTPHGGQSVGLWNKDYADPTLVGSNWEFYTSTTASNTVKAVAAINPESMLCLSCHDGSISVNHLLNYGQAFPIETTSNGQTDTPLVGRSDGTNPRIGGNIANVNDSGKLGDDHPISFSYRDVLIEYGAKPGLKDPDPLTYPDIRFYGGAARRVECPTCHDPHVDYKTASTDHAPFLTMSNAGSAMCLVCHDK